MTYLDLARRGRNAVWRYLIALPLGFILFILISVAVLLPLILFKVTPPDLTAQMTHATNPALFFAANGLMFGGLLVSYWAAIRLLHGKTFTDLVGVWRWSAWAQGIVVWGGALIAASLLDLLLDPKGMRLTLGPQTPMLITAAVPALAVQTFAEEFVFRGYITQGLYLLTKRPVVTALLSGLVFGSVHIPNGWPQAANAVVFGVALALIVMRTRSLAFGYGLHLANNIFGAVVVVSGGDVFRGAPGIFTQTSPQLSWWDTLFATALLAAVAALVLLGKIRAGADAADAEPDQISSQFD